MVAAAPGDTITLHQRLIGVKSTTWSGVWCTATALKEQPFQHPDERLAIKSFVVQLGHQVVKKDLAQFFLNFINKKHLGVFLTLSLAIHPKSFHQTKIIETFLDQEMREVIVQ